MKPKLLIIGHGRHGKDTVADVLSDLYGFRSVSSSMVAAEQVVRPWLQEKHGLSYLSLQACYEDRINHRQAWYEAICDYNRDDLARLCSEVLDVSDIYCGMRCDREFYASRHMFDYVIGVTAFNRVKALDPTFRVPLAEADFILTNDGTEGELRSAVIELAERRILT